MARKSTMGVSDNITAGVALLNIRRASKRLRSADRRSVIAVALEPPLPLFLDPNLAQRRGDWFASKTARNDFHAELYLRDAAIPFRTVNTGHLWVSPSGPGSKVVTVAIDAINRPIRGR
jgi:hypothetical protein